MSTGEYKWAHFFVHFETPDFSRKNVGIEKKSYWIAWISSKNEYFFMRFFLNHIYSIWKLHFWAYPWHSSTLERGISHKSDVVTKTHWNSIKILQKRIAISVDIAFEMVVNVIFCDSECIKTQKQWVLYEFTASRTDFRHLDFHFCRNLTEEMSSIFKLDFQPPSQPLDFSKLLQAGKIILGCLKKI